VTWNPEPELSPCIDLLKHCPETGPHLDRDGNSHQDHHRCPRHRGKNIVLEALEIAGWFSVHPSCFRPNLYHDRVGDRSGDCIFHHRKPEARYQHVKG
jgi:hypothetical protein